MTRAQRRDRHKRHRRGWPHPPTSPDRPASGDPSLPFQLEPDEIEATEPDLTLAEAPADRRDEPSTEDLLFNAARRAAQQSETRRAIGICREILAVNAGHVETRIQLALLLNRVGEREMALRELDNCLERHPCLPAALVNRGAVLGSMGRFNDAETDLTRALGVDPSNVEAHYNLGLVKARKGLWADALPHLRRAIELDPGCAEAYMHLGDALNHVDDLQGALQSYSRSVELRPENPKALFGLGVVYDRLNQPEEAAHLYRRSRELSGA